jgi:hypothetical protein
LTFAPLGCDNVALLRDAEEDCGKEERSKVGNLGSQEGKITSVVGV